MRTIIVTDIHGCYPEFVNLLKKVSFQQDQDTLIILGDIIDRGAYSYEMIEYVRELQKNMKERCIVIRGNHEQMMLDAVNYSATSNRA